MDVAQDGEEAALLQRTAQKPGVLKVRERDIAVALEPKVHEVEVLRDDRVRGARKVERERVLDRAEVVQLEDEVLREELLRAPDDPADTDVRETELVPGGVDRDHARDAEVPLKFGVGEGRDEAAGCAVDVNGHGVAGARLVLVEEVGHLFDGLVVTGVGAYMIVRSAAFCADRPSVRTSKNDIDTDGVLVDVFHRALRVEPVLALLGDGYQTALNVEVAGELFECDLCVRAHHDVGTGLVDRLSGRLALLLPDALHRKPAELDGLGRASSGGSDRLVRGGCVPQISELGDAAGMEDLWQTR